jgi:HD-GYP domain-containing protein (c-di-GMP phosphodiesterase class II)/DNA-binding CsgD family transcriptional regulator
MSSDVQRALACVFEQWDGSGPQGARGEDIPFISRIVYASAFLEVFHRLGGRAAAERLAEKRKATAFDPLVVDTFLSVARDDEFWMPLDHETIWDTALAMEPDSDYRYIDEDRIPDVALSFADFADLKSPHLAGHSRHVADLAARTAARMRVPKDQIAAIQMAALVHDLGLVAVASFTLEKPPNELSKAEQEGMRLHPYHGERILARIPSLRSVAQLVATHHERLDGAGYYRGLTASEIPVGARIIAVADVFEELTRDRPGHLEMPPDDAIKAMAEDAGRGLDADVLRALGEEVGTAVGGLVAPDRGLPRTWPAGLTEREVEVLRLLARGKSRRDIAAELILSEGTVRSHLEHIYGKIDVSTQVAAVLFAIEHGLL